MPGRGANCYCDDQASAAWSRLEKLGRGAAEYYEEKAGKARTRFESSDRRAKMYPEGLAQNGEKTSRTPNSGDDWHAGRGLVRRGVK